MVQSSIKGILVDKDKWRHLSANISRAKGRPKPHPVEIDVEYLYMLGEKQGWRCALTGRKLQFKRSGVKTKMNPNSCSIDRINSNKGYVKRNVQLVIAAVNKMKSDLTPAAFKKLCEEVTINGN